MGLKKEAESLVLEVLRDKAVRIDTTKLLVPFHEDDLEATRNIFSLAVHGIRCGTTESDIKTVFHKATRITIALRGGTAFLAYDSKYECEEDFINLDGVHINGVTVVVMFGHCLKEYLNDSKDLRGKLETSSNRRQEWSSFLNHLFLKHEDNSGWMKRYKVSFLEISENLLSSSLMLERMTKQFRSSKDYHDDRDIKLQWLDDLVASWCERMELQPPDIQYLERGDWRELVEDIWDYFMYLYHPGEADSSQEREDEREKGYCSVKSDRSRYLSGRCTQLRRDRSRSSESRLKERSISRSPVRGEYRSSLEHLAQKSRRSRSFSSSSTDHTSRGGKTITSHFFQSS